MPTLKERLEKLEKKLADLNAKHPESHQQTMLRYEAPTSYAKNRADARRSKVELERRGITQKISVLQQKLKQGGTRRSKSRGRKYTMRW
jgi:predicted  nucleic acid-binding Zn-ribbon protein